MVAPLTATNTSHYEPLQKLDSFKIDRIPITKLSDDPQLLGGWRDLVSTGRHAQPFFHPEWFQAFARSFAARSKAAPELITLSDGEGVLGVLPMLKKSSFFGGIPARTLASLSGIHSCRFDLITGDNDPYQVGSAVWSYLKEDDSWDVIEALDVPQNGAFNSVLNIAEKAGYLVGRWPTRRSPVLNIPSSGDDPYANCPNNFKSLRKRFQRTLANLRRSGAVSFHTETRSYEDGLARFLLLESAGWKGANKSAIASDLRSSSFYSAVVESLHGLGCVRLYSLCVDSKPIAMQLGLYMDRVYYSPKVAYDEAFAKFSPGHLLVRHIIADLFKERAKSFEFLGPRAFWKAVWAGDCVEHSNSYIFRPGVRGRILHALTMRFAKGLRGIKYKMKGDPQRLIVDGG